MQKDEILKSIHEMFPHAEAIHIFSSGKAPSDTATDMAPNCTFSHPSPLLLLCVYKKHMLTSSHAPPHSFIGDIGADDNGNGGCTI